MGQFVQLFDPKEEHELHDLSQTSAETDKLKIPQLPKVEFKSVVISMKQLELL